MTASVRFVFGSRAAVARVLAVVGVGALISACGSSSSSSAASASSTTPTAAKTTCPVKVFVVAGFTGPTASNGASVKSTVNLTVSKINASGGVLGCPIAVTYADDGSDPTKDLTLTRTALATGSYAMVYAGGGGGSVVAPYTTRVDKLTFVADGVESETPPGSPIFGVNPGAGHSATLAGTTAGARKLLKAAVVISDNATGVAEGETFAKSLSAAGGKVVDTERIPIGNTNDQPVSTRIKNAGADVVYLSVYGPDAGMFLDTAHADKLNLPTIGGAAVFGTNVPALVKPPAYAGLDVVGPSVGIQPPSSGAASLISLLKAGNVKIDQQLWLYALPHDVMTLFAFAANGAKSVSTNAMVAYLKANGSVPVPGLAQGTTSGFSSSNQQQVAPFEVATVAPLINGQWPTSK